MGFLNRLMGGNSDMMGIEQLAPQTPQMPQMLPQPQQQQPSTMDRLNGLLQSPSFHNNMQMAATGEPPSLQQMQQLRPQMPPQPGGMNALQNAFSTSPEFQAQLGAIYNQTSPGYQQPTFTPPAGGAIPPLTGATQGQRGGRLGGASLHSGFSGFPGSADDEIILRRFLPQTPTRL